LGLNVTQGMVEEEEEEEEEAEEEEDGQAAHTHHPHDDGSMPPHTLWTSAAQTPARVGAGACWCWGSRSGALLTRMCRQGCGLSGGPHARAS
jgi:hypothetical protein